MSNTMFLTILSLFLLFGLGYLVARIIKALNKFIYSGEEKKTNTRYDFKDNESDLYTKNYYRILTFVVCVLLVVLAYFAGRYNEKQTCLEDKKEQCCEYITYAIDIVETRDLEENGIREVLLSYVFAAHERCNDPKLSAELNNIYFTLIYQGEQFVGKESELANMLRDILSEI